jgi:hypothetical protein
MMERRALVCAPDVTPWISAHRLPVEKQCVCHVPLWPPLLLQQAMLTLEFSLFVSPRVPE